MYSLFAIIVHLYFYCCVFRYIENQQYKGTVVLHFSESQPSVSPTQAPSYTNYAIIIEFSTTVTMNNLDCSLFYSDTIAVDAAEDTTARALHEQLLLSELSLEPTNCGSSRRLLSSFSRDSFMSRRNLVNTQTSATWKIAADITRLGYANPSSAYNAMKTNMEQYVMSGNYTLLLRQNGAAKGTSLLVDVNVTSVPLFSDYSYYTILDGDSGRTSESLQLGLILGVVIGVIVFISAIAAVLYVIRKRRLPLHSSIQFQLRDLDGVNTFRVSDEADGRPLNPIHNSSF